jgi:NADH-quinone oxidoreductase subunit E
MQMCNFYSQNEKLFSDLNDFIDKVEPSEGALIQVLHRAQQIFGYLPKEVQLHISKKLNIPPSKVYGVVTFYSYFKTEPIGKYKISVCTGTVCFVKGADKILAEFEKQLGIKSGETTDNLEFSLESLRCVGACGLAPVVTVNDKVYGNVTPKQVCEILDSYKEKELQANY